MSLYVPGEIVGDGHVMVDIGTGFLVEKSIKDAMQFYSNKTSELDQNLKDIEGMAQGKSNNLRMVEEVLRGKVAEKDSSV